jgi:hypothetical protein
MPLDHQVIHSAGSTILQGQLEKRPQLAKNGRLNDRRSFLFRDEIFQQYVMPKENTISLRNNFLTHLLHGPVINIAQDVPNVHRGVDRYIEQY